MGIPLLCGYVAGGHLLSEEMNSPHKKMLISYFKILKGLHIMQNTGYKKPSGVVLKNTPTPCS